ncbi:MAG: hypothetical protein AAB587_01845 [Patescibacteria group bacterium]
MTTPRNISKVYFKFILTLFMVVAVTPFDIQWEVNSINMGRNDNHGGWLEKHYNIAYPDGKWNCQDRAEVAAKLARKYGYRALYGYEPKHRYVILIKDGKRDEILRKSLKYET